MTSLPPDLDAALRELATRRPLLIATSPNPLRAPVPMCASTAPVGDVAPPDLGVVERRELDAGALRLVGHCDVVHRWSSWPIGYTDADRLEAETKCEGGSTL